MSRAGSDESGAEGVTGATPFAPEQVIVERLTSQGLSGPPSGTPEEIVTRLLAVQAQDPRGVRLSIRSRSVGLTAGDVDDALDRGSVVITWVNRGTLHMVTPQDYWWLHQLTTPQLAVGNARRLRQEGVNAFQADLGVDVVARAVTCDGPQTRAQLRRRLAEAGVPTGGQAFVHVLVAASLRGHVVRGPVVGGEAAYVSVRNWLGEAPPPVPLEVALSRLARRYLAGHGPADARDLAKWAGIPFGRARGGLDGIADELVGCGGGLVHLAGRDRPEPPPPPRLLGAFDPVLLGWVSRRPFVGRHQGVVTTNGLFRPFALVDGRVVATWGLAHGELQIRCLEPIAPRSREALQEDGGEVLRFLGLPSEAARVIFD